MSCKCKQCKPVLDDIPPHITHRRTELMSATPSPTPSPVPSPETILEEAQRLVHGNRGADYGHPIVDYKATGRMWGAILERWLGTEVPDIDPRICCVMMMAVKLSREAGKHKRDNLTDTAGYAECADMVAQKQGL